MKQVLVRGLGDEVVSKLKKRAERNHRSLQGELHAIITSAAESGQSADESVGRLEAQSPRAKYRDSALLIRENRDGVRNDLIPGNSAKRRAVPKRSSVWDWLSRRSVGKLSKVQIDKYMRAERDSWDIP